MSAAEAPPCPLCARGGASVLARAHGRGYRSCAGCGLVFVEPEDRPDPAAERAHYGTHRNQVDDPGYRRWLARLADPLRARLAPGAAGLDFGCGPGPALAQMLEEHGFRVAVYDPFFAPDPAPLAREHDFVTCTEVFEHFHAPAAELDRLRRLLRPGGWLGVTTELFEPGRSLTEWRYARDPTHVALFRAETMEWIAARLGWTLERPARGVFLFRRPE